MIAIIVAAILAAVGHVGEIVARDRVDLIELNHCYDEDGERSFAQVVFYRWIDGEYRSAGWISAGAGRLPRRVGGVWRCTWCEIVAGGVIMHVADAPHYRETWTQFDPEMASRVLGRPFRPVMRWQW